MRLVWDISNKCNLKCQYCCSTAMNQASTISAEEFENIIKNIGGPVTEIEFYGGEPFLALNNPLMYRCLKENNISISITTNGQFDSNYLKILIMNQVNITNLIVSIDGFEELNDKTRGIGSYAKSMRFLKDAITQKRHKRLNCNIIVETVVSLINIEHIIEICELWFEKGVDKVILSPVYPPDGKDIGILLDNKMKLDLIENIAEYTARNSIDDKIFLDIYTPLLAEYLNAKYGTHYSIKKKKCDAMINSLYVDSLGNAKVCRESKDIICNLKNELLGENISKVEGFLSIKDKAMYKNDCNCIYADMCEVCCLKKVNTKSGICAEIKKRYSVIDLCHERAFKLNQATMWRDESYKVFFLFPNELIEYEEIGYRILECIRRTYLTSTEIALEVNAEAEIVFRFLVQEYANGHVGMEIRGKDEIYKEE